MESIFFLLRRLQYSLCLVLGRVYEFNIAAVTDEGVGNNATEKLSTPDGIPGKGPLNLRYEVNDRQVIFWNF